MSTQALGTFEALARRLLENLAEQVSVRMLNMSLAPEITATQIIELEIETANALIAAFRVGARAVAAETALSLLEDQWKEEGFCGSCSWHAAWYEVVQDVEESLAETEIWVSCHRKDGEGSDHRGAYLSNPNATQLARLERVLGKNNE